MINEQRLKKVAEYAEQKILNVVDPRPEGHEHAGPIYRWQHTLRVSHYGRQIAEEEGANVELCAAACLLHDVEWFSDRESSNHGRIAAEAIRPFLEQVGYPPEEVDNICYSVAVHVDGKAGYEHEHTLEARVVSDADNIDRFGAYRILQWCVGEMDDLDSLAEKLRKRLVRLEEYLNRDVLETPTGNRLFKEQVRQQVEFFRRIVEEQEMTRVENGEKR
jgi:uncharacterized protein